MRRPIVPIALVLALTTGAWVGQAYTFFAPMDDGSLRGHVGGAAPGGEGAVRAFYAGVETFFTTGDDTAVRAVVGEDFVEHAPRPGTEPTREGLLRYLGSLRRSFPDLRLEPRDVVAQGDRVVVRVEATGTGAGAFLGMPLAGGRPWAGVDVFRVVAGRIAEHWGDATGQTLLEPITSGVLTVPSTVDILPALTRRSYAPGAGDGSVPAWGPLVLFVESGTVVVEISGGIAARVARASDRANGNARSGDPPESYGAAALGPGDALTVAEPARIETRNEEGIPAEVLVLSLVPALHAEAGGEDPPALPVGVTIRPLADAGALPEAAGQRARQHVVAIGRAVLPPGVGLGDHVAAGPELVLVQDGVLALTVGGGMAWLRHPNQTATAADRATDVAAGIGLGVPPGATGAYRNDGSTPLTLFVVTISPVTS